VRRTPQRDADSIGWDCVVCGKKHPRSMDRFRHAVMPKLSQLGDCRPIAIRENVLISFRDQPGMVKVELDRPLLELHPSEKAMQDHIWEIRSRMDPLHSHIKPCHEDFRRVGSFNKGS
jgi:hypothetical protein